MKNKEEIDERMIKGGIPGASIAYFKPGEPIRPEVIGKTDVYFETPGAKVEPNTKFGAASLSKAVFSYLVLKMISDKKFTKPFTLDTPISEILPIQDFYKNNLGKEVSKDFIEEANKITPRMVLSHSSGIPINGAPRLEFPPGTAYSYGNTALYYLQKAIEKDQNMSLEKLAKAEIFQPLNMAHSSFVAPGSTEDKSHAANTLHTTPSDYARLTSAWMQVCGLIKMSENPTNENQKDSITSRYILTETGFFYYNKLDNTLHQITLEQSKLEELQDGFAEVTEDKPINNLSDKQLAEVTSITEHTHKNETLHEAFKPQISLMSDQWAKDLKVSDKDRQHLAWGLGFGLQLDEQGKVTTAFHSGDMNQWRGWVAMDMETKSSVVLLTNGNAELNKSPHGYGHVLAELIVGPEVKLEHAFNWFFQKFGVSRDVEPGWKAKEDWDTARIDIYVRCHLNGLPKWQFNLIDQLLSTMHDYYCLPEKFEAMKASLANTLISKCKEINETTLASGTERSLSTLEDYGVFVVQINEVLHGFDPHLELEYNPAFIKEMTDGKKVKTGQHSAQFDFSGGPPKEEVEKWNKYEQDNPATRNYGFIDYQGASGNIPDNIGYVNISHLIDPQLGATESEDRYRMGPNAIKRLHAVMEGLREKEGIILDLSVTPYGGSPEMVQNVVSFFMPDGTPINTVHDHVTGEQKPYEAIRTPCKLLDKPVVLLVGPNTFSGREETAYDLQQFNTTLKEKRFTVMGQSTKGGAHPECSFPLLDANSGEINDSFVLRVPYATSINPISGTNWEDGSKSGVQPDIEIPKEENALNVVVKHINSLIAQYSKVESVVQTPRIAVKAEELLAARERMSEFRAKMPHKTPDNTANREDEKKDDSLISPFQTTLKPKFPGED